MKPTLFQIQEAIAKNICRPDTDEMVDILITKPLQTSTKREGDSTLGQMLFIGISSMYGFKFADIGTVGSIERDEYDFKLHKFKQKMKSNDERFRNKCRLVRNYLKLTYNA